MGGGWALTEPFCKPADGLLRLLLAQACQALGHYVVGKDGFSHGKGADCTRNGTMVWIQSECRRCSRHDWRICLVIVFATGSEASATEFDDTTS